MSQYGMLQVRDIYSDAGRKVLKVFEKLKNKADDNGRVRHDPRLAEHDDDLRSQELQQRAMKSLHFFPEVMRTEEGFQLSGSKGLDIDYYDPGG